VRRCRRVTVRAIAAVVALAAVGACAPFAWSAPGQSVYQSPLLWATVNVCDTVGHPDAIGIRGSMPGSGDRKESMFMRFQIQYVAPADGRWHNLGPDGDSGFVPVGSARFRAREAGRTFTIMPPASGSYLLRGVVTFEWREGAKLVRRARQRTTAGHAATTGSDPSGFSAATCEIR
jgi:hypothetical protein